MSGVLTFDAIKEAGERLKASPLSGVTIKEDANLREQFRFPRSKKRRIRNKWADKRENWRPIRNRAFLFPGRLIVCHPDFSAELRRRLKS